MPVCYENRNGLVCEYDTESKKFINPRGEDVGKVHKGTLYRESGFALGRTNKAGVETWWRGDMPPLSDDDDAQVRAASRTSGRSQKKRHARGEVGSPSQEMLFL